MPIWKPRWAAVSGRPTGLTVRTPVLTGRYHRLRKEIERLLAMEEKLADAPAGQKLPDPDARAMAPRAPHSGHVGYNVQSVVDAEPHPILAHEVTTRGMTGT